MSQRIDRPGRPHSRFWALAHQRCPRCRVGPIFQSTWRMNDRCPRCGLLFVRDTGYFTGAMYFSYALGVPVITLLAGGFYLLLPDWALWKLLLLAWLAFLPLVPVIFRYSRVFWIHFDRYFDLDGDDFPPP